MESNGEYVKIQMAVEWKRYMVSLLMQMTDAKTRMVIDRNTWYYLESSGE